MTKTQSIPKSPARGNECDAPGHEKCSGWVLCKHMASLLADEEWCDVCDEGNWEGPVWTWCPDREN